MPGPLLQGLHEESEQSGVTGYNLPRRTLLQCRGGQTDPELPGLPDAGLFDRFSGGVRDEGAGALAGATEPEVGGCSVGHAEGVGFGRAGRRVRGHGDRSLGADRGHLLAAGFRIDPVGRG